jgi:release factor glutamine methyltransferase
VRDDEFPGLAPEVRDNEPDLALRGGTDGIDAYRTIVPQAAAALVAGGWLAMEMGRGQALGVAALIRADGRFEEPVLVRDGSDIERVVAVQRGKRWT